MKRTKADSKHFNTAVNAVISTKEEWLKIHRNCEKQYLKSVIGGEAFKFIVCVPHGDVYADKDTGGAKIETPVGLVDIEGKPL